MPIISERKEKDYRNALEKKEQHFAGIKNSKLHIAHITYLPTGELLFFNKCKSYDLASHVTNGTFFVEKGKLEKSVGEDLYSISVCHWP